MSTTNIPAFFDRAISDPALAAKIEAARLAAETRTAEALAALAVEAGLPFTAEEFLSEQRAALSDESLEQVAGGAGYRAKIAEASHERQTAILGGLSSAADCMASATRSAFNSGDK